MHVTFVTQGVQGEVQPMLALALGMKNAGVEVRFCARSYFQPFIEGYQIPFLKNTVIELVIQNWPIALPPGWSEQQGRTRTDQLDAEAKLIDWNILCTCRTLI